MHWLVIKAPFRGDAGKERSGSTGDLKGAKVTVTGYVNGEPRTQLELLEGFRKVPFGLGASLEITRITVCKRVDLAVALA